MKNKGRIQNFMSNDPDNWKGIFYVNRRDPRLVVPKLNPSMGWTLNFANPWAWAAATAILLIIALTLFL